MDISVPVRRGHYKYNNTKYFAIKFSLIVVSASLLMFVHLDYSSNTSRTLKLAGDE